MRPLENGRMLNSESADGDVIGAILRITSLD
jgi:hypothetical protein